MKAFLTWFKNSFVQFLDGLQKIGGQSPSPFCESCLSPTLPTLPPPPTSASTTKRKKGKTFTGAKADFQKLLDEAGVRYFDADEVFYRGARDARLQLNTDPPRGFWPSLLAVVKIADEARHRLGKPLRINSGFRSAAYNRAIKGAVGSFHTKAAALDLSGSPATLHRILQEMRREGLFRGGIGRYKTFVHVDVRGKNADW
jgi:lysozyme